MKKRILKIVFICIPFFLLTLFAVFYIKASTYNQSYSLDFSTNSDNKIFRLKDEYGRKMIKTFTNKDGEEINELAFSPISLEFNPENFLIEQDIEFSIVSDIVSDLEINLVCDKCNEDLKPEWRLLEKMFSKNLMTGKYVFNNKELKEKTNMKNIKIRLRSFAFESYYYKESRLVDKGFEPMFQVGVYKIFGKSPLLPTKSTSYDIKSILSDIFPKDSVVAIDFNSKEFKDINPGTVKITSTANPNFDFAITKMANYDVPSIKEIKLSIKDDR